MDAGASPSVVVGDKTVNKTETCHPAIGPAMALALAPRMDLSRTSMLRGVHYAEGKVSFLRCRAITMA